MRSAMVNKISPERTGEPGKTIKKFVVGILGLLNKVYCPASGKIRDCIEVCTFIVFLSGVHCYYLIENADIFLFPTS